MDEVKLEAWQQNAAAAKSLSRAGDALIDATFSLMAAGKWEEARAANNAARAANSACRAACDAYLSRWWVRLILFLFGDASVDTLPKGQDAKQGLAGTEGSAVPKADAPNQPPPPNKVSL